MSLKKPPRVYVLLSDPKTGKTRGFTVYNRGIEEVLQIMRKTFEEN